MPIYEYECQKCGHHAEVLQKFSDPPVSKCEKCKGKMRKLISQSSFHLKGTGWYVTDYASKNSNSASTSRTEKSEKTEKTEKAETKSPGIENKTKESSAKASSKPASD